MSESADTAGAPRMPRCWVLSDGKAGIENPCLGLAEALALTPEVKRVRSTGIWGILPPYLIPDRVALSAIEGDALAPPWPDLVIAGGKQSVAPSRAIRKAAGDGTFVIQTQNPDIDPRAFDLIATPEHDRLQAPNVVATKGSINRITPERLTAEAERAPAALKALPRPRIAFLIGGASRAYRLPADHLAATFDRLEALLDKIGGSLLVTASRRTDDSLKRLIANRMEKLAGTCWLGPEDGDNPYFAYLALADHFLVTADSVNMVSEAASTGKPVQVVDLPGGSAKFQRFHRAMRDAGITRPFQGELEDWDYEPLDEARRVAAVVRQRLAARGFSW